MNMKLVRPQKSKIAGVCEGLGQYFDIDPNIFRLIFTIGVFTPYPIILTYLICWILIPKLKIEKSNDLLG